MVLLEDIDAVFDGRENITGTEHHAGVTYDCLLNCISGAEDSSGILIVITTNRIEKLDDALGRPDPERGGISRRPGRIDWMIELPILSAEGRRKLAKRILCDWPEKIEQLVAQGEGDTGAQFQERCVRIALDYYWEPSADTQYFGKTRVHDEPVTLSFKSTFGT
jgi:SpoVK/Ycf46/Vps4 family AAA+-type ATPase